MVFYLTVLNILSWLKQLIPKIDLKVEKHIYSNNNTTQKSKTLGITRNCCTFDTLDSNNIVSSFVILFLFHVVYQFYAL
jgi:hypothetical protein